MGHTHHSLQDKLELIVCSMFTGPNVFGAGCVTISSHMFYSDNCFSFTSMLTDTMRSMDVSRSPDSLTSSSCFP